VGEVGEVEDDVLVCQIYFVNGANKSLSRSGVLALRSRRGNRSPP
jgi:hypothetical protein